MICLDPKDVVDPNNRPLSEDERRRIIFNNRCLVKLIDPYKHDFLSHLVEKDCITFSHFQRLTSMSKIDKSEMISELFTILLRRSFVHFQLFIQCLKCTLQHNLGQILESNGVVLIMQVNLKNSKLEKHIAEVLTGTIELDDIHLDVGEKQLVEDILKSLEEKGPVIVGGAYGSLIVYILLLSSNAVNELEKLYKTKELETYLNTVSQLNVTIKIDDDEFTRCRRFFSEDNSHTATKRFKSIIEDRRDLHCKQLNNMPLELIELILERTSWMMWVCVFIEALQLRSMKPLKEYLRDGIHGFSNFVKVSSTLVYQELSSVCIGWRDLLKSERYGESIKSDLLSNISRTAIKRSEKILIDGLHIQDGLLDLYLNEKLITTHEKFYCESMPGNSNEMFLGFLWREKSQSFTKLLKKVLLLLKKQCKSHLVNYVISFGVHWPNFGNKWPLDKMMKFLVNA